MNEREKLEKSIAGLEAQRAILGDAVVNPAISALRAQLAALDRSEPMKRQRKQVTILFADISNFTEMFEVMDAEDVGAMVNAIWQRLDQTILAHGGYIDKHIGDAVMALWGINRAREDDPQRAIQAALAIQKTVADFGRSQQVELALRIGINTGTVLLGEVGVTGEYTAMGDAVNLASRLEEAAAVGDVLISHATYRRVRGVFDVALQEPLMVKGKRDPVQTYVIHGVKPRLFQLDARGVESMETRMVGRDAELAQLKQTLQQTINHQQTMLVTVVGEAGVGKSRLLFEFDHWLELHHDYVWYFKGRAQQQTTNVAYFLLRDLFAYRFQIRESDSLGVVWEKMEAGVAEFLPDQAEARAHILGAFLGYDFSASPHLGTLQDEPDQLHELGLQYLAELFTAAADSSPVAIFLEDIHWADGSSLSALMDLLYRCPELPLMVVALARPVLFERYPEWGKGYSRIDLFSLSTMASLMLVAEILQKVDQIPDELAQMLTERAEGNPYYLEELVKMLIDDGVILVSETRWQVIREKVVALKVPSTLAGVLQARLDWLQPAEKATLQQASVVGRIFWDAAVGHLAGDERAALYLPALQRKDLVFLREQTAFSGTKEYIFKHNLLRDVTYETVLKQVRRMYHVQVAGWLVRASEANNRVGEYAALIAEHYELGGQPDKAREWYSRARKPVTGRLVRPGTTGGPDGNGA